MTIEDRAQVIVMNVPVELGLCGDKKIGKMRAMRDSKSLQWLSAMETAQLQLRECRNEAIDRILKTVALTDREYDKLTDMKGEP